LGRQERVVDVFATVAPDISEPGRWIAQTTGRDPRFVGLFAYGGSFDEARSNLADVVLLAVVGAPDGTATGPVAVAVFATTVKMFRATGITGGARAGATGDG
jgi:hypothetical protein